MIYRKWCYFLIILVLVIKSLSAQELTFVTINVWSGLDYEGAFKMGEYESRPVRQARYRLLVKDLKALDPDVIAVNEANPLPGYARRLARDLKYDYIYSVGMAGIHVGCLGIPVNFREGDAILARKGLGLRRVGAPRLSPGSGIIGDFFAFHFAESNQAIAGRITVEGKDIYVVNAHLHAGLPDDERWGREMELHRQASTMTEKEYAALVERWRGSIDRRQSETQGLLAWMRAKLPPEAPVVLMGDFNAQPQSEEITWVLVDDFIDTWAQLHGTDEPGSTWEPESNLNIQTYYDVPDPYDSAYTVWEKLKALNRQVSRRIDYIFVKKVPAKYILRSEVVFDQVTKGQHPSDHFGVLATIRLNSKQ